MTTIRRITTSQIQGGVANDNDTNEIRPNGETAFYIDDSSGPPKLTLMMFDGVRTNLKSKVLAPGVLYGSNADSGDGGGADTIKLIPDSALGTDQYIVVDPSGGEPGHIHLRAGGTQDASSADLYLGGELTHIRISDTSDDVKIRTTSMSGNINWTFDSTGTLHLPPGGDIVNSSGTSILGGGGAANTGNVTFNDITIQGVGNEYGGGGIHLSPDPSLTANLMYFRVRGGDDPTHLHFDTGDGSFYNQYFGDDVKYLKLAADGNINVGTNSQTWTFTTDGNLILPQTDMYTSPAPTSLPGITWTDGTFQTGKTIELPQNQNFELKFPSNMPGGDGNVKIYTYQLATSDMSFSIAFPNDTYFGFSGSQKRIQHSDSNGFIHFGSETREGTGHGNDIELKSYGDGTNGNVYIAAGGSPTNTRWAFQQTGKILFPDASQQSTAYQLVSPPAHSTGSSGDKAGMVAYDANYHYYCKDNFGGTIYTIASITSNATQSYLIMYSSNTGWTSADLTGFTVTGPAGYSGTVTGPSVNQGGTLYNIPVSPTVTQAMGDYVFTSGSNIWVRVAWTGTSW